MIKRKYLYKIIIILICLMIIGFMYICSSHEHQQAINPKNVRVNGETINIYSDETGDYLFLPSFAVEKRLFFSKQARESTVNIMNSSDIASMFIDTQSGSIDKVLADKEYREAADMTIYDTEGNILGREGLKYIKGHGNYSFFTEEFNKKPFSFVTGDNRKYTLVANASDATFVRNDIARQLEIVLGVSFAKSGEYVDLYINHDYYGVYYLVRNIEIAEDSIDISSIDTAAKNNPVNPEDITGGYILEREFYDRYVLEHTEQYQGFITEDEECFIIHEPNNRTEEENKYIAGFLNRVEDAIDVSLAKTKELIDIDSFVARYLSDEITKNYDAGVSSAYFFKDSDSIDGRLYYGPGWDFDRSLGNYDSFMIYRYEAPGRLTFGDAGEHSSSWYRKLYQYAEYRENVVLKYKTKAKPYISMLLEQGIDDYYQLLRKSAEMDSIRWRDMYRECGYVPADYEEYDSLRNFIRERTEFLDSVWIGDK